MKKYQAKMIPDENILNVLADYQGTWSFWSSDGSLQFPTDKNGAKIDKYSEWHKVYLAEGFPAKVVFTKLKSLNKRGLIGGCACGCRGDFEITDKGLELIGRKRIRKYTGY